MALDEMLDEAHEERLRELIPADRRRVIASLVRAHGSVRGRDLVALLGVTDETIRRDILKLAASGAIRRSRGGAVAIRPLDESGTDIRLREHSLEKLAIGARAAELVAGRRAGSSSTRARRP